MAGCTSSGWPRAPGPDGRAVADGDDLVHPVGLELLGDYLHLALEASRSPYGAESIAVVTTGTWSLARADCTRASSEASPVSPPKSATFLCLKTPCLS